MTGQQIDRDRLRELASGATPGPWEAQDYDDHPGDEGSCVLTHEPERGTRAIAYAIAYPWTTPESCEADAEFIAASRQAVPALLDQLDQAEADRDWNIRSSRLSKEERIKANARADQAEARIKAVRALLDQTDHQHDRMANPERQHRAVLISKVRRALDGEQ